MLYYIQGPLEVHKIITKAIKMAGFKPIIYQPNFKTHKLLIIHYKVEEENLTLEDCTNKINSIINMLVQDVAKD